MTTIDNKQMLAVNSRTIGEGRGAAFREKPTAETAAALVAALAANLANLSGVSYKSIMTAAGTVSKPKVAAAPEAAAASPAPAATFKKDDAVLAKYNEEWYPAKVVTVKGSKVEIAWDQGGTDTLPIGDLKAKPARGRPPKAAAPAAASEVPAHLQVDANVKVKYNDGKWYPAKVTAYDAGADLAFVSWADGSGEAQAAITDIKAAKAA